jgi:hypothetical protein
MGGFLRIWHRWRAFVLRRRSRRCFALAEWAHRRGDALALRSHEALVLSLPDDGAGWPKAADPVREP